MNFNKLKALALSLAMTASAIVFGPATGADAAGGDLLYENKDIQTVTDGVTYEKSSRLYKAGWMDVYVLTIDVTNPNVEIDTMESLGEYGLKQPVLQMAKDNKLLAAVNGDFFGSGNPFSSMGQVAEGGRMKAAQNYYNGSENKYAGFFMDTAGQPFIDYVKTSMGFYVGSAAAIEMGAKNKITNFSKPVYFDTTAMENTARLDSRVKGLSKIVVKNGVITQLSTPGQVVNVPKDGYIIVMDKATADKKLGYYLVGMKVNFVESNKFVFRPSKSIGNIVTGLSGGGELLRNGQNVEQGLIIGKNARHPRTLIGVNQSKTKVIIMCIDGRANGIGATHVEAANLMREYGAWDAIHFDGGGSTTMALRQENNLGLSLVNVPSEGSQRQVANGIGVRSLGKDTQLASLNIVMAGSDSNYLFKGAKTEFYVYGYDGNHNPVEVDKTKLELFSTLEGSWDMNSFTPTKEGEGTVTAKVGNIMETMDVRCLKGTNNIRLSANTPVLTVGQATQLITDCINADGYELGANVGQVEYTVDNPAIGHIENGYFIADGDGVATVTATVNGFSGETKIAVGKVEQYVYGFENPGDSFNPIYFPENEGIRGGGVLSTLDKAEGDYALRLDYLFVDNKTTTQCTYAALKKPIALPQSACDLVISYKGDGTGNLLKAQIKDGANNYFNVEITPAMTDTAWNRAFVPLPEEAVAPVSLEKLYVAALSTAATNVRGTVYIDGIGAMVPAVEQQQQPYVFTDYMRSDLTDIEKLEDISLFGGTTTYTGEDKDARLNTILTAMAADASAMVFAGYSDAKNATGVTAVPWQNKYGVNGTQNFELISLATGNGCLRTSNPDQWRWFIDYVNKCQKPNIVITMDKYIWGSGSAALSDPKEAQLLHSLLKKCAAEQGKNIVVVSSTGMSNYTKVKEGVRYVNLAGMAAPEGQRQYLRLRTDGSSLRYSLIDVN